MWHALARAAREARRTKRAQETAAKAVPEKNPRAERQGRYSPHGTAHEGRRAAGRRCCGLNAGSTAGLCRRPPPPRKRVNPSDTRDNLRH